jgi:hypothetical protein
MKTGRESFEVEVSSEDMGHIKRTNTATSQKIPNFVVSGCMHCFCQNKDCEYPKFAYDPQNCPLFPIL